MTDLSATIAPRSDQMNSDDLIAGPRTITITAVKADPGSPEQPIAIYFEGDNGKPYKPCKSMRRVMVQLWGADGAAYPGRAMTLYRDPDVLFGGMKVGGIRISHMTNLDNPVTLALTASKAKRANFTVRPLAAPTQTAPKMTAEQVTEQIIAEIAGTSGKSALDDILDAREKALDWLKAKRPDLHGRVLIAIGQREHEMVLAASNDEFPDFESAPVAPPTGQTASADGHRPPDENTSAEAHPLNMPVATYDQQLAFLTALGARFEHATTGDEVRGWYVANEKAINVCQAVDSASKKVAVETMRKMDAAIQRLEG